jgi:hypothetical protein
MTDISNEVFAPRTLAKNEDCSVSEIYRRLKRGEYEAYRDGRSTKITGSSVQARRQRLLETAPFTPRGVGIRSAKVTTGEPEQAARSRPITATKPTGAAP